MSEGTDASLTSLDLSQAERLAQLDESDEEYYRSAAGSQGSLPQAANVSSLDDYRDRALLPNGTILAPKKITATPYLWRDPAAIPARDWLLGEVLLRGQVHGKVAPGGYGKTFHTIGVALSLATGRPLLGQTVWGGRKRVWIWNLEDPLIEITRAIQAACKYWGITREDLDGWLFVDSALDGADLKFAKSGGANGLIMNSPLIEALTTELIERQIDYLDVDPFVSSHNVDENDNGEIDAVIKAWSRVAVRSGTAINLTHHVKKLNGGVVTAETARGAVSFGAALRSALVINGMSPAEGRKWGISKEQGRRYIRVYDDKGNRAPPANKSGWFYLESVDLANAPSDGSRPSDNVAVLTPWTPPGVFENIATEHLISAQAAIAKGDFRLDSQANDWVGHVVGPIVGRSSAKGDEHAGDRAALRKIIETWVSNGSLRIVHRTDNRSVERPWIVVGEAAHL